MMGKNEKLYPMTTTSTNINRLTILIVAAMMGFSVGMI
jgi:hypothetical protein